MATTNLHHILVCFKVRNTSSRIKKKFKFYYEDLLYDGFFFFQQKGKIIRKKQMILYYKAIMKCITKRKKINDIYKVNLQCVKDSRWI